MTQCPERRRRADTVLGGLPPLAPAPENAHTSFGELAPAQLMPLFFTPLGNWTPDQRRPFQCCPIGNMCPSGGCAPHPNAHALADLGATTTPSVPSAVRATTRQCGRAPRRFAAAFGGPSSSAPAQSAPHALRVIVRLRNTGLASRCGNIKHDSYTNKCVKN